MKNFCPICNKEFEMTASQKRSFNKDPNFKSFCSRSCASKYNGILRRERAEKSAIVYTCKQCGKKFKLNPAERSAYKYTNRKREFCSNTCRSQYRKNNADPNYKENYARIHREELNKKARDKGKTLSNVKRFCAYCHEEFLLTNNQVKALKRYPDREVCCSKECRYSLISKNTTKTYPAVICPVCNKKFEFESSKRAIAYFSSPTEYKACCSANCKQEYRKRNKIKVKAKHNEGYEYVYNRKKWNKKYYENNKDKITEQRKFYYQENKEIFQNRSKEYYKKNKDMIAKKTHQYYKENKEKLSKQRHDNYMKNRLNIQKAKSIKYCNKDFSPHQNGGSNLSISEMHKFTNERIAAVPKARKSRFGERTSERRGVCLITTKDGYTYYKGYLKVGSRLYYKQFKTEAEAIAYRTYLENTYYTPEQLKIRDKYSK